MTFDEVSEEAGRLASEAAVRACWAQWAALGSPASRGGAQCPTSIIDIEALVLLSLAVRKHERRLPDLVAWWAHTSARLTSVQRLRTLAKVLPGGVGTEGVALFARLADKAGDRRWARHIDPLIVLDSVRVGKGTPEPSLIGPSTLWPRLRAGFGVGTKADILTFLLGLGGGRASVRVISLATKYSSVAVRDAVREMSLARLIREFVGRPAEYSAPPRPWGELLELYSPDADVGPESRLPRWRSWADLFSFLSWVEDWARGAGARGDLSRHTLASEARDIVEAHSYSFDLNAIATPPISRYKGLDAGRGLLETTRAVVDWMEHRL